MQLTSIKFFPRSKLANISINSLLIQKPLSLRMLFLFAAIFFLTLSLLFLVWIRISQLQSGYLLAKLEAEQIALLEQSQMLDLEIAVLKRPERIHRLAIHELNLKAPTTNDVFRF